jgi:predicted alpha/beta hydrolase family esterase
MDDAVIVTVPGLRGPVAEHWQTRLEARLPRVRPVPPLGRDNVSLADRVAALTDTVERADGPVVLVAHSAGVFVTVHWALHCGQSVVGALLATPPDLAAPLPPEYPSLEVLADHGWLPIPMAALPFPSIVAASSNDSLSDPVRVREMARAWGSRVRELGPVGHLNPASGFGDWPQAESLIDEAKALR